MKKNNIQELFVQRKQTTIEKFAIYLLNKMKRDISFSIRFNNDGYMMAGHRTFIYNDTFLSTEEAKQIIIRECENLQ